MKNKKVPEIGCEENHCSPVAAIGGVTEGDIRSPPPLAGGQFIMDFHTIGSVHNRGSTAPLCHKIVALKRSRKGTKYPGEAKQKEELLMRADKTTTESVSETRRRFLETCGRFSIATPPAIALLLAASKRNYAVAHSGGGGRGDHDDHEHHHHHDRDDDHGNNGFGNGGDDGVPGHSHHEDRDR